MKQKRKTKHIGENTYLFQNGYYHKQKRYAREIEKIMHVEKMTKRYDIDKL